MQRDLQILGNDNCLVRSTRPVRDATCHHRAFVSHLTCFNPRAPCGTRRWLNNWFRFRFGGFNPRAPCGTRPLWKYPMVATRLFQSTRPVRDATFPATKAASASVVSIHAPRAGRDQAFGRMGHDDHSFNPRAPCGTRLMLIFSSQALLWFQSTRPVRDATFLVSLFLISLSVSIHAPRAGRDDVLVNLGALRAKFQSTRPVRDATSLYQLAGRG